MEPHTCAVIRVTRSDTMLIRTFLPQVQASVNTTMVLCGVRPTTDTRQAIIDWVEVHADFERLRLLTPDWTRDSYGRLLADLGDLHSGELLTDYLRESKACEDYPQHYFDTLTDMMTAPEPQT
jgi:hypothetical protein